MKNEILFVPVLFSLTGEKSGRHSSCKFLAKAAASKDAQEESLQSAGTA